MTDHADHADHADQPVDPEAELGEAELGEAELGEAEPGEAEPGEVDEREHALLEGRAPLPPLRDVARLKQPSTLGGAIYLVVLVLAIVGIVIAATGAWRTGVSWLGAAMIAAAISRVILPEENAGMLKVRPKLLDVLTLAAAGALLLFLAATIPNQPH